MSQLIDNGSTYHVSHEMALRYLAGRLPDDAIIVSDVVVPNEPMMPAISAVIITRHGLLVVALRDWHGPVQPANDVRQVLVGEMERIDVNPLLLAREQARVLRTYLLQPEQAQAVFTDVRLAQALAVRSLVLFSHPDVLPVLPETPEVDMARLDEVGDVLAMMSDAHPGTFLAASERQRLLRVLAHPDALPAPAGNEASSAIQMRRMQPPIAAPDIENGRSRFIHRPPEEVDGSGYGHRRATPTLANWVSAVPAWAESRAESFERQLIGQSRKPITAGRLAGELEKQLENTLNHLLQVTVAHNAFTIGLGPEDYASYLPIKDQLEGDLGQYLQQVIASRDYTLRGTLVVEVVESTALSAGECGVQSRVLTDDGPIPGRTPYVELAGNGRRFPLARAAISIGRARENDICLGEMDKQRIISRHHARIRREEHGYVLYDEGSSRGTYVAGRRLGEEGHPLQDGDSFVLGPTQWVHKDRPLQGSVMFTFRIA